MSTVDEETREAIAKAIAIRDEMRAQGLLGNLDPDQLVIGLLMLNRFTVIADKLDRAVDLIDRLDDSVRALRTVRE